MKNEEEMIPMEDTMENAVNKLKDLGYLVAYVPAPSFPYCPLSKEDVDNIKDYLGGAKQLPKLSAENVKTKKGYKLATLEDVETISSLRFFTERNGT